MEVSESRREEELRNLAEKREEDLKMFAAQHQVLISCLILVYFLFNSCYFLFTSCLFLV